LQGLRLVLLQQDMSFAQADQGTALASLLAAIEPASERHASTARARLAGQSAGLGCLPELAARLAAARFADRPPSDRKLMVLCAADHGIAAPADRTHRAANLVARGVAPVNALARAAGAQVAIVNCGLRAATGLEPAIIDLPIAPGTDDVRAGPAMTSEQASAAIETGIALTLSAAGEGLDLIAIAQLGDERAAVAELLADQVLPAPQLSQAEGLAVLARWGGFDYGALAGICLAAAAIRLPVVLDGTAAPVAAALACRLAPATAGYLIAGHAGASPADAKALAALGLVPVLDLALTAPGCGAAVALPVVEAAGRLLRDHGQLPQLPTLP
jgi:nicotinate-nucleotide--dimethylbenzimidazole phosphoribosyltransferase